MAVSLFLATGRGTSKAAFIQWQWRMVDGVTIFGCSVQIHILKGVIQDDNNSG